MITTKKAKQLQKLLHKKLLSSKEAVRLAELTGRHKDKDNPGKGSHQQMEDAEGRGKTTIPMTRKVLRKKTRDKILEQLGLKGD